MGMDGGTTTYSEGETRHVAGHQLTELHIFPLADIPEAPAPASKPADEVVADQPRSTERWPGVPPIPFPTHPPTAA